MNIIMQKLIAIFLFLITFNNLNAQTDEQILHKIFFDLFDLSHYQQDTILIEKGKRKTYFEDDSISFEYKTGLTVPSKIISEWKKNEENQDFIDEWNEHLLNRKDTIIGKKPIFKCLSRNEIIQLFDSTQKRQGIYSVSKILFDDSKENAIFHFTVSSWHGSFYSVSILIKKIFGKWVIIDRYDYIMS